MTEPMEDHRMTETATPDPRAAARERLARTIEAIRGATGWSDGEVRSVIGAVTADDPDRLMDDIGEVLEWCVNVERMADLVGLWKTLPPGIMEIRWTGTEPACRIRPSCEVTETPEGYSVSFPDEDRDDG